MYVAHHATAVTTGARIVHACGFDSIPHDLGALFTVAAAARGRAARRARLRPRRRQPSGGTFHSAMTAFSRVRQTPAGARGAPRRPRPRPDGAPRRGWRASRTATRRSALAAAAADDRPAGRRSLGARARALRPDFTYGHYAAVKRLPVAVGGAAGVASLFARGAGAADAQRRCWAGSAQATGRRPSARAKSWFTVRFVGEGGGKRVVHEVSGGDPGYTETAKMLAESALCLAFDDKPPTAGQVTTAVAMGDALIARLQRAGIAFEVLER